MIDLAEGADQGFGLGAVRVGLLAREAGLDMVFQRVIDARGERRRAPQAVAAPMISRFGGAFVLPARLGVGLVGLRLLLGASATDSSPG